MGLSLVHLFALSGTRGSRLVVMYLAEGGSPKLVLSYDARFRAGADRGKPRLAYATQYSGSLNEVYVRTACSMALRKARHLIHTRRTRPIHPDTIRNFLCPVDGPICGMETLSQHTMEWEGCVQFHHPPRLSTNSGPHPVCRAGPSVRQSVGGSTISGFRS